jgi:hypothetical protein
VPLEWRLLIDWDGVGGLNLGSFETGMDEWRPGGPVDTGPAVTRDDTRAYDGDYSARASWPATSGGFVQRIVTGFVPGRSYTLTAWHWHEPGDSPVAWVVGGLGAGPTQLAHGQWAPVTHTFTATSTTHDLQLWASIPTGSDVAWFDRIRVTGVGADVTGRVLAREPVTVAYGRDQARSLSPGAPAEAGLVLDNRSRDYSPENAGSPLAGYVLPNRDLLVEATYAGKAYTLFRGRTDAFDVRPGSGDRAVSLSAADALAELRGQTISTPLLVGTTTGGAVHAILDAVGWPAHARDVDQGATGIRFWWEEQTDAGAALEKVINSEGPPAAAFISASGDFVFRGRHHRLTRLASLTSQATFSDVAEPAFSPPLVYDQGWRDVINSVTLSVEERVPAAAAEVVWTSDTTYVLSAGETQLVRAELSDPVFGAITPVSGVDFQVRSGSVSAALSRTSGAAVTILLTATAGGPAVVDTLQLRAYPVAVRATTQVHAEDPVSIQRYRRRSYGVETPWAGRYDAEAIAQIVLAHRAERLPIVTFAVKGGEGRPARLTQQLARDLSDRVTVVDAETGLNDALYVDRIEHTVSEAGKVVESVFGCEKVPVAAGNLFRFDVAGRGFDDGVFATVGRDEPDTIFRFDTTGQGFDDGIMAH